MSFAEKEMRQPSGAGSRAFGESKRKFPGKSGIVRSSGRRQPSGPRTGKLVNLASALCSAGKEWNL